MWEYIVALLGPGRYPDLNDYGSKGWELVSVLPHKDGDVYGYFKRQNPAYITQLHEQLREVRQKELSRRQEEVPSHG